MPSARISNESPDADSQLMHRELFGACAAELTLEAARKRDVRHGGDPPPHPHLPREKTSNGEPTRTCTEAG